MPDYDEEGRSELSRAVDETDLDIRASAELDEETGGHRHPLGYVDSESLASHNLKIIRRQLGVSQQQIADRLPDVFGGMVRLAQTQIAKIERGERPWRVNEMFAIAEALGVEWHEFFRGGPKGDDENDDHLVMLGARIKYKQAQRKVELAKEAWIEASREELKAGVEMARTAADLGIEDPVVLRFLEFRSATALWTDHEEERIQQHWSDESFNLDARMEEIQENGRKAWERLLEEAKEKAEAAAEQNGEE
ncbi:helix-turn-helix domain-containing protein [Streptomyces sp. NPDC060064]|uniref:helix-turn-helix domain-containing protein n=1 Tax=Streptomyces sp. NPDC060064 TaxID=3347049 RepID=UPI0036CB47D1